MKLLATILLLALALLLAWAVRHDDRPPGPAPEQAAAPVVAPRTEASPDLLEGPGAGGPEGRDAAQARVQGEPSGTDAPAAPGPATILLTVVDHEREPIHGATVRTFDDSVAGTFLTDEAGECRLPVAPSGASMRLEIDAEGSFHVRAYYRRMERLVIRMPRAVAMTGRVLDTGTSAPVPGARVELAHAYCKHCAPERTTADERGVYNLAAVPVGRNAYFAVSAAGFPTDAFSFALPDDAEDGFQHDFRLQRGIVVAGQVVDFLTGAPVVGAAIRDAGRGTPMASTDADGRFSAAFLPGGYYGEIEIGVAAPDYCRARLAFDPKALEGAGPFPIRLPRVARIEGVVRDAAGAPVADARVQVREDVVWIAQSRARGEVATTPLDDLPSALRLDPEGTAASVRTDAEGHFRTGGFVPWTPRFTLDVRHAVKGARRVAAGPLGGPGESTWVEVALASLPDGGSIHGRMLLNGDPIGGKVFWRGATRSGMCAAEEDGGFRLVDVEPGEVWLYATPQEQGGFDFGQLYWGNLELVRVTSGERLEHDLALELRTTTIAGRVVGPAEALERGPSVTAVAAGSRCRSSATCDASGAYSLEVPDDEDLYFVSVDIGDLSRSRSGVHAGATGVDFAFPALGRVRYKVIDAESGELLANCNVAWSLAGVGLGDGPGERFDLGSEHWRTRSPEGWIDLSLPVGIVELHARNDARGYLPTTVRDVQVTGASAGTRVILELAQGLAIALELADGQARLPVDHRLYLFEEHAWEGVRIERTEDGWDCDCGDAYEGAACLRRAVHFEGGRAQLRGLPAGAYRFKSFPPGIRVEPERIEVTGEETEPFVVRWTME